MNRQGADDSLHGWRFDADLELLVVPPKNNTEFNFDFQDYLIERCRRNEAELERLKSALQSTTTTDNKP